MEHLFLLEAMHFIISKIILQNKTIKFEMSTQLRGACFSKEGKKGGGRGRGKGVKKRITWGWILEGIRLTRREQRGGDLLFQKRGKTCLETKQHFIISIFATKLSHTLPSSPSCLPPPTSLIKICK